MAISKDEMEGNDPILEPVTLMLDEDVQEILEKGGFMAFLCKFNGYESCVSNQFAQRWKNVKVSVCGMDFVVNLALLEEVTRFPTEGETIWQPKHSQLGVMNIFFNPDEKPKVDGLAVMVDLLSSLC